MATFQKVASSEVYIFTTILNTNRSKNINQLETIDLDRTQNGI